MQKPWPAYFKSRPSMPYSFNESSRLHNKAYIDKLSGQVFYPDDQKAKLISKFPYLISIQNSF